VNKNIRISTFIAGAASLALASGTLSTSALANAPDRSEPAFMGEPAALDESLGIGTIFSDMAPMTVGKLNIDTGHVMLRPASRAATPGTLVRRPVTGMASAHNPRVGNNTERN
jgi:hypothetical protein